MLDWATDGRCVEWFKRGRPLLFAALLQRFVSRNVFVCAAALDGGQNKLSLLFISKQQVIVVTSTRGSRCVFSFWAMEFRPDVLLT